MRRGYSAIFLMFTFFLFVMGIIFFSYTQYQKEKTIIYEQIDDKLKISALAADSILTPAFHDRALEASSISKDEDTRNIDRLSKFAKSIGVVYVYTMVERNGKIYFTSSSATEEERKTGINLTHYFDNYNDASDTLKKVFETYQVNFDETPDKWGIQRSIFIPMKSHNGHTYVVGADINVDLINKKLDEEAYNLLLRLFITIILSLPFLTWYLRRNNYILQEEKKNLSKDVQDRDNDIKRTNNKLRAIFDATQESILLLDQNGIILAINEVGAKKLDKKPNEMINQSLFDYFPSDITHVRQSKLEEIFQTGESVNYEDKWGNSSLLFHCYPVFDENGATESIAVFGKDITQMKFSEERIKHLSNFDLLTQLPNKEQLETYFFYILTLAQRNKNSFAVLFLDLDHFKNINDAFGHKVGDRALMETATRLKSLVRESDIVARFSGDEFVLILATADMQGAEQVAKKILAVIDKPYYFDENELNVTTSIGIAIYPSDGLDIQTLSKNADTALYRAKQDGRNSYCFVTKEMQEKSARYLQLSHALRSALKNNELYVVYQPQVSLKNREIVGAEALLRWNHPEFGNISPAEFIPIAEDNGTILAIGEWVLHRALSQLSIWMKEHPIPFLMAVNLSAVQFRHPKLVSMVMQTRPIARMFGT